MHKFFFYNTCTCFEHCVLIIRRSKLYYTAFGIITPVGGRPVHLYMFRALCAHHQEVNIVLYSLWYHHTCRWPSHAPLHVSSTVYSSSGDQNCIIQPLVSSHLQVAVPCTSTCFEHCVLIIRRSKLYYTAFGIITPLGGRPVHLYMFRAPCARHQEIKILLYSLWYHHTCRWSSRAQDGHLQV